MEALHVEALRTEVPRDALHDDLRTEALHMEALRTEALHDALH